MHQRLVVTVDEGDRPLDQRDRHQMRAIHVRHGALADDSRRIGGELDENIANVVRGEAAVADESGTAQR